MDMMETSLKLIQAAADSWLVAVCPDDDTSQRMRRTLASALPEDATFSGRTAALAAGGRISVVALDDETFDQDRAFQVTFLGCGSDDKAAAWRTGHTEVRL